MYFADNITLDEVTRVIDRHNESLGAQVFIRAERGPYVIFNYVYQFTEAFPERTGDPVRDREVSIIHECRGLTFYADTGLLAARKYHKAFNLGQNPSNQIECFDFTQPHVVMKKLDGSLITPALHNGEIEWHTKMGNTDVAIPVRMHVANLPHYDEMARFCIEQGFTPMFEWCSRQQRIVIDYPDDSLIITNIRENSTGRYLDRSEVRAIGDRFGIEVVETFGGTIQDIHEFIQHTRDLKGEEGYVIQFPDGRMVKLKADDYCAMHNSKEKINQEKNVIAMLVSESMDDFLTHFDAEDRSALITFQNAFMVGVGNMARDIGEMMHQLGGPDMLRKDFAKAVLDIEGINPLTKSLLFKAHDGSDLIEAIIHIVSNHTSTATRIDFVRYLFGDIHWKDYRNAFDAED